MFIDKYLVEESNVSNSEDRYTTLACGTIFGKWTHYDIPSNEWDNEVISDKIFADLNILFPLEDGYIWEWQLWNGQFESRSEDDYLGW